MTKGENDTGGIAVVSVSASSGNLKVYSIYYDSLLFPYSILMKGSHLHCEKLLQEICQDSIFSHHSSFLIPLPTLLIRNNQLKMKNARCKYDSFE